MWSFKSCFPLQVQAKFMEKLLRSADLTLRSANGDWFVMNCKINKPNMLNAWINQVLALCEGNRSFRRAHQRLWGDQSAWQKATSQVKFLISINKPFCYTSHMLFKVFSLVMYSTWRMESSTCGWNFTLRDLNQDYGELFIQNRRRYNTISVEKTKVWVSCKSSIDKYITNYYFCLTESWDRKVWIPVYFCRDWRISQEDSRHWRQQIKKVHIWNFNLSIGKIH